MLSLFKKEECGRVGICCSILDINMQIIDWLKMPISVTSDFVTGCMCQMHKCSYKTAVIVLSRFPCIYILSTLQRMVTKFRLLPRHCVAYITTWRHRDGCTLGNIVYWICLIWLVTKSILSKMYKKYGIVQLSANKSSKSEDIFSVFRSFEPINILQRKHVSMTILLSLLRTFAWLKHYKMNICPD